MKSAYNSGYPENPDNHLWPILLITVLIAFMFFSCKPQRIYVDRVVEREVVLKDTVVEFIVKPDTVLIQETVFVNIDGLPYTSEMYFRETEFCAVSAWVRAGQMIIELQQKDAKIKSQVQVEYITEKETLSYPVFIEKELKWWQRALIWMGGVLLITGIGAIIWRLK